MTFVNVRHFRFPFQPQMAASARGKALKVLALTLALALALALKSASCPKSQFSPTSPLSQLHSKPQDMEGVGGGGRRAEDGQRMSLTNLMSNIFVVSLIFL